jgi:DNA-binding transcriptional LysR family regulator
MQGMFEWDDARFLLAVHRNCSLSAAARCLGVNQSTVGRRLRALDEALGIRAFVQTSDGFVLSPAGERLLAHATRMEDEAIALERQASGAAVGLTGTVRVTSADALSARIVAPLLAELHGRAPGLDLELIADTRTYSLSKREADVAVRTMRPREAQVVMRRICGFASSVYASKAYVEEHGRPREADLAKHPFIGVEDTSWNEARWLQKAAPGARVLLKTNSTLAQLAATLAGIGLGILPCYIGDPEPELVRLVAPDRGVVRELLVVCHKDLRHTPRIRICTDFLVDGLTCQADLFEGRRSFGARRA